MSQHKVTLLWQADEQPFAYKTYTRNHRWTFENGATLEASAAPAYLGDATRVDPEQAFVGSLASCHMLTFLALAAFQRIEVKSYRDEAVGRLEKNVQGKVAITRIDLYPQIEFASNTEPDRETLEKLHRRAHADCFLANSVSCEIVTHLD